MQNIKRLLLGPYYAATLPWRACRNRLAVHEGKAPVMVVYYHRIADDTANSWTVSNREFRQHIRWLQQNVRLVSLEEAQRRIASRRNDEAVVAITFDDGYAENCEQALPWLIEQGVPCTYFVTTHYVLTGEPFPHDVAMGNRFAPNTVAQLRDLAAAGIEIGAHTRTHADLGAIRDFHRLADEVVAATHDLADAVGQRIRYFAFPFGMHANLQPAAFGLAREAGLEAVCSAYGGYNRPGDDPFHIQRFGGEGPLVRLKNWVTVDPLKEQRIRRYQYRTAGAQFALAPAEPAGT